MILNHGRVPVFGLAGRFGVGDGRPAGGFEVFEFDGRAVLEFDTLLALVFELELELELPRCEVFEFAVLFDM